MSLVALKNAIIGRPKYGTFNNNNKNDEEGSERAGRKALLAPGSRDSSWGARDSDSDVESQTTRADSVDSTSSACRRFKVDARLISDATIGLSDGLTVPFALTAGLSALGTTRTVIFGGLAELIAGAISMGLGGYLGAKSEAESYREARAQTVRQITEDPCSVADGIREVFAPFAVPEKTLDDLTAHLSASPRLVDFVMQFQHGEQEPASSRALTSALTIALGYFLGGMLPLAPYFFVGEEDLFLGLYVSVGVMAVALFTFGYVKTCIVTGWKGSRCVWQGCSGGLQMVVVGGAAAGAAMGLVKAFDRIADASM